ncbi:MAG: penicillin-binding protein 2 [Lentimonas sp.]|jgi:penicillin-binding protein 2
MSQYDSYTADDPRIFFFLKIIAIASLTLIAGLAWSQLFDIHEYQRIEKRQTERRILMPGPRGDIYDRNGKLLVGNRPHYSAVTYLDDLRPEFRKEYSKIIKAERKRIIQEYESTPEALRPDRVPTPNYSECAWNARLNVVNRYVAQINAVTGRDDSIKKTKLIRHFNEQLLLPLPLAEDLTPDQYARLVEQIPVESPIQVYTGTARYYPYGELAAHLLGYVQNTFPDRDEFPNDGIKTFTFKTKLGKTGLEHSFNDLLTGTTGMELWRVDPLGFQDTCLEMTPPKQGAPLIASIDIDLQLAAEIALGERTGAAVVLDVQSGEVLTILNHPTFDLNDLSPFIPRRVFDEINERGAWLNRALQLSYPPGSTFKLVTSIAGLRNGTIDATTTHDCQGVFPLGRRIFRCHSTYGHGKTDLPTALEKSCNIFYYSEGVEMGIDILSAEAKRFGLDQRTGIEVPFETKRLVIPSKTWKKENGLGGWVSGDTANTAIGQGFLLQTPLQMATLIASIARNETRTRPTLRALTYGQAIQVDHGGEPIGLTPAQKDLLWEGMERVVGTNGTGRLVQIDDFRIAGKTGTADFRAHGKEVNLAWFIGFAPVENPQIAVAVMVEGTEESQTYQGGSTAGPIAKDIFLKFIEKYPERAGFTVAQ